MQYKLYPASLYYNPFCCNLPVPSCHSCYSISPYKSPSVSDTLTYSIGTSRQVSHALAEVKCILA